MEFIFFQLESGPYALRLDAVAEIVRAGLVRRVPLAGPAVRGLAERRGRPIAIVDLPRLLDDGSPEIASTHLVRLAPPLDGTALWVPAEIFSGAGHAAEGHDHGSPHVVIGGRPHLLLDPEALVRRAAAAS